LSVHAETVSLQDWQDTVPVSGSLLTLSAVDIKAEVGGRLTVVNADVGALVRKGELLAEIDDANYQLAYRQAKASVKVMQAGLEQARISAEYAKTEKERADNLLRTGGITQKDHQAAITRMKEADAQVTLAEARCLQAEASLDIAEKALKDCLIHAVAAGNVQKRWVDEGTLISPGESVFTIVDNSRLELQCVVPSYYLSSIKEGQSVEFTTTSWEDKIFKGELSAINPSVQLENRSVKIKVSVENPGMHLRSGMYARGHITTGIRKSVPVIPRDALVPGDEESESAFVFIVDEGVAKRRLVTLGGKGRDRVWIQDGLNAGDWLIIERGPSLKDGVPVDVASGKAENGR
ncbi:MAG: efflux RND transporter periplasmic adaptor subunit, partial [Acidobacteriota bacterium]